MRFEDLTNEQVNEFIRGYGQTDAICYAAVRYDGCMLKYIKNKTISLCGEAIKNNPEAVKYSIVNPLLEELAVRLDGMVIKFIPNPSEKVCMLAVKQNGLALQYIDNQTPDICQVAVDQNPKAYNFVKNKKMLVIPDGGKTAKEFRNYIYKLRRMYHKKSDVFAILENDSKYGKMGLTYGDICSYMKMMDMGLV